MACLTALAQASGNASEPAPASPSISVRAIPGLNLPARAPWQIKELAFLDDQPFDQTIDKVASGQAGSFIPLASNQINNRDWYRSIWLRIHLVPKSREQLLHGSPRPLLATTENTILLGMSKPYLDDIILFTPTPAGSAWQQQRGGDQVAQSEWTSATRGLLPRFALPTGAQVAQSGEQGLVVYLQIKCMVPSLLSPQWLTQADFEQQDFRTLTLLSLCSGAMLLIALNALAIAVAQRNWLYVWYGLYAGAALMATASHSGLAHKLFWPIGGQWPGTATLFFLVIACVFQVYFCRNLLLRRLPAAHSGWLSHLIATAAIALCCVFVTAPSYWKLAYFALLAQMFICAVVCIFWMTQLARAGEKLPQAWFLFFVPMYITVITAILDGIGLIQDSAWVHTLCIVAASLEVVILGMFLQFFARARHGEIEHQRALASTDPLTGFVSAASFQALLKRDWHAEETKKYDMAVVYIELQSKSQNTAHRERLLLRSVRILRSATDTHDVVARLDGQLMAILMPQVQMGDDLSQRLSRVIALGLMPDRRDTTSSILQFRMAATTQWSYTAPLAQLDVDMRRLLAEPSGWSGKTIRYLAGSSPRRKLPDTAALDELWEQALEQERRDTQASVRPST